MVREIILLTLAASAAIGIRPLDGCTNLEMSAGGCSVGGGITRSGVDLTGEQSYAGGDGGGGDSGYSGDGDSDGAGGSDAAPGGVDPGFDVSTLPPELRIKRDDPTVTSPDRPVAPAASAPITIRDVASFNPAPPTASMEPNGWAVLGLHTNFIASAPDQVLGGALLGRPAQVRFHATRYLWDYGDSATRSTTSPGATWTALRQPEFSATATSHVYRVRGSYAVTLTARYAAEYRFDGGAWLPVVGTLPLAAPVVAVAAADAKTVLVGRDCAANPRGPGC